MVPTPRINWLILGAYILLSLAILIGAIVSPPLRGLAYAPLRDLLLPEPDPIVVDVLYSTEKAAWLEEVVVLFEQADPRVNGRPIEL
ncbi:MAG: hypothetical protein GYB68_18070, partial [Chloroflexi bacterium]|nr:hypothetical protein [Chloroflexota bacterium]